MYKKTELGNGLRIICFPMPSMQSAAVGIWIKVGGRHEVSKEKGISHFLEHLLFKGSSKYSCRRIKESIEGVGGSLNGFTSEELTCYLAKMPADCLDIAIEVLSDMVLHPSLPVLEVEKEKHVILEEMKMYRDLPQSYVYELLDELMWPNQPLGAPIIGTFESVTSIQREELAAFKKKHYTPSNIIFSAAGSLDFNKLVKKVSGIFSSLKSKDDNVFLKAKEEQRSPGLRLFAKDTEQTHLALGFHSLCRDHPLRHALAMLHIILGANMSSRLFEELREKRGLAYEIGSAVKRFGDTGAFIVHAGIDNQKVSEALSLILLELKKTKDILVGQDEFKRAKDFYLGQLKLALEDTLDHMLWIGESTATIGKTYTLQDIIKEVNNVKKEDIRKVAQSIFKEDKLNLALIGPIKDKEEELQKQLKTG